MCSALVPPAVGPIKLAEWVGGASGFRTRLAGINSPNPATRHIDPTLVGVLWAVVQPPLVLHQLPSAESPDTGIPAPVRALDCPVILDEPQRKEL